MPRQAIAALTLAAAVTAAVHASFDGAPARRIADAAMRGRALEYATALTATIGARLSGSPSYERAAAWAVDQFRAAGVTSANTQPFSMDRGWRRAGRAAARTVSPAQRAIALESLGWTPPTPEGGIEAEIVALRESGAFAPAEVRGRIVFMNGGESAAIDRALQEAGALALLFEDPDGRNHLTARMRHYGGGIAPLPSATVARDDTRMLRRLIGRGPVRLTLSLPAAITAGPVAVSNVIADIPGRERPGEYVLVGAHLDSWDSGTGAQDNATGVAMVLEAARAIAAAGRAPRRSIRFALWGGEEQGLLGSAAYAASHERELDRVVAVLNTDGGTGRVIGWTAPGRDDVMSRVRDLSRALLAHLGAASVDSRMQYAFDSDGGSFVRRGIPTLDLNVDDAAYEEVHHKTTDTIDRVTSRNLAVGAAAVAATAYAIADLPARLAPRGPVLSEP